MSKTEPKTTINQILENPQMQTTQVINYAFKDYAAKGVPISMVDMVPLMELPVWDYPSMEQAKNTLAEGQLQILKSDKPENAQFYNVAALYIHGKMQGMR